MKYFAVNIFCFLLLTSLRFGEPAATLTCRSASGKTIFKAEFPDCSYVKTAMLTIDTSTLVFYPKDFCHIIFDPASKVFAVYLQTRESPGNKTKFLRFWALPSNFLKTHSDVGPGTEFHDIYEFRGRLECTDPRGGSEANRKTIELNCVLDYGL